MSVYVSWHDGHEPLQNLLMLARKEAYPNVHARGPSGSCRICTHGNIFCGGTTHVPLGRENKKVVLLRGEFEVLF